MNEIFSVFTLGMGDSFSRALPAGGILDENVYLPALDYRLNNLSEAQLLQWIGIYKLVGNFLNNLLTDFLVFV